MRSVYLTIHIPSLQVGDRMFTQGGFERLQPNTQMETEHPMAEAVMRFLRLTLLLEEIRRSPPEIDTVNDKTL